MIAIVTAARDGKSYLRDTISYVNSSASDHMRFLFVDGAEAIYSTGWTTVNAPKPDGCPRQNKWTAFAAVYLAADMSQDLILLEDDVRFCRNGMHRAEITNVPSDVAFLSLFAPFGDMTMPEGIWRASMANYGYAQALKIPLRTCVEIANNKSEMTDSRFGTTDGVLRDMGVKRGWLYGVHYPGLAQHVGETSVVSPGSKLDGRRISNAYPGDDFDAMSLWSVNYS